MRCLIITKIGFPFGGGEDFLLDSMSFNNDIETYWISFCNKNQENINFSVKDKIINVPGGISEDNIIKWLKLLRPDFIHTQGHNVHTILKIGEKLNIPVMIGFHFWLSLIELNPRTFNKDIEKNILSHKKSEIFDYLINSPMSYPYVCSSFMQDIVYKVTNKKIPIINPSSGFSKKCNLKYLDRNPIYITQINIHKLKGGEIFLQLLDYFPNLHFMCVQTESFSEELDEKIKKAMSTRTNCVYSTHTSDIKEVYNKTKILLIPSLVDETFCRVCNEAIMNSIPIITSGYGNIKNMIENDEQFIADPNDINQWISKILHIYDNLNYYSSRISKYYILNSIETSMNQFNSIVNTILNKKKNLMILAPFCDQGLGIQTRNYANILKDDFNIFIFSFQPYYGNALELQKDTVEWQSDDYIIEYSSNIREKISDKEIIDFVKKYQITDCFLPETCWNRVFEIAKLFKILMVNCYAIPNIEIVRKDEIFKHEYFYKILCNNQLCYNIFNNYGFKNLNYIGYGEKEKFKDKIHTNVTKFLCIGGMNAYTRKRVDKVCKSFILAYEKNSNITLTVTIQGNHSSIINEYYKYPFIKIITDHLSYKDILNLYYETNVTIHVSSHEGLGIGFYESLSTGTPVITLDTAPHNEIIKDGINGWIIPCYKKKLLDNPESLIEESHFNETTLAEKIIEICPLNLEIYETLKSHFRNFFKYDIIQNKIKKVLYK